MRPRRTRHQLELWFQPLGLRLLPPGPMLEQRLPLPGQLLRPQELPLVLQSQQLALPLPQQGLMLEHLLLPQVLELRRLGLL